ncbi:MAG: Lrp/AsnC family transcriptional regulator [Candidatus Thermoplasmatota archaeon]|nr:Lrp/AsnC family transcriptional regulator [Candidatus Thermoplasmatota archaeon]
MDETDIRLCQMLFANSRAPIRDLADRLNISIQATHRRMQNLKDEGVIHRYITCLSVEYLHTCRVYVSGRTKIEDYMEIKRVLGKNDMVYVVLVAGEEFLNISFIPREMKDLESISDFVVNDVRIPDPFFSIESQVRFGDTVVNKRYTGPPELSSVDHRIVRALQGDSRKAVEDIADELNLSARTVKRHLDRMIEEGAVEFGLDWNPAYTSGNTSLIMVKVRQSSELGKVRDELFSSFGVSIIFITSFINLVDVLGCYSWTPTVMRQKELVGSMGRIDGVEHTMSKILQDGWVQETWRDRLLAERAGF